MNHTKENLLTCTGEFTWNFGQEFFVETEEGNFIWSDPDYDGDNTFRYTEKTYQEWIGEGSYGRSKGNHIIREYCGDEIVVIGKEV
jgi:hypothetical protein